VVYLVLLILSALLTVGALAFWLQANVPVGDTTAEALKKLRFGMFLASLAPLAGSTVTYFWYRYAVVHGGPTSSPTARSSSASSPSSPG